MVATTTAAVGVAAALAVQHLPRLTLFPNPTTDALVKTLAGLGLVILGAKVENGYLKAAIIGVGAGAAVAGGYALWQQHGR